MIPKFEFSSEALYTIESYACTRFSYSSWSLPFRLLLLLLLLLLLRKQKLSTGALANTVCGKTLSVTSRTTSVLLRRRRSATPASTIEGFAPSVLFASSSSPFRSTVSRSQYASSLVRTSTTTTFFFVVVVSSSSSSFPTLLTIRTDANAFVNAFTQSFSSSSSSFPVRNRLSKTKNYGNVWLHVVVFREEEKRPLISFIAHDTGVVLLSEVVVVFFFFFFPQSDDDIEASSLKSLQSSSSSPSKKSAFGPTLKSGRKMAARKSLLLLLLLRCCCCCCCFVVVVVVVVLLWAKHKPRARVLCLFLYRFLPNIFPYKKLTRYENPKLGYFSLSLEKHN